MIRVEHLSKVFDDVSILKDITIDIHEGEVIGPLAIRTG